ncbi:dihydrodipicolinate reductase [Pseudooceanicola sp. 200-1SW]|uniref:dihydrodipicolinate reductase n=1 Tax=Pseudooceanicola sp. 200-1SW TaxID=3425949 RepID=UPI003D7FD614
MSLSHPPVPQALSNGLCALACLALLAPPAAAQEPQEITTRHDFTALVDGARLTALGVTLRIRSDGRIRGEMLGTDVSGRWHWRDSMFCHRLGWGDRGKTESCQSVTLISRILRFTGPEGEIRDFWLRR